MTSETPEPRSKLKAALVFSMLFAVLGAVLVFGYYATFRRPVTTIILVRHAEKIIDPNNSDPDLSPAGQARAQEIFRMSGDAGVNAIYATQYKRTQETVRPLADKLRLPVTLVNSTATSELVRQIHSEHRGQTILVSGHNNTVPEVIAALGGPQLPVIPETEFDNLYIVTVYRTGKAKLVKIKYGSSSTAEAERGRAKQTGPSWDGYIRRGKVQVRAGGSGWSVDGVGVSHTEELYDSSDAAKYVLTRLKGQVHPGSDLLPNGQVPFNVT